MTSTTHDNIRAMEWLAGSLRLLDQRVLPGRTEYVTCNDAVAAASAITDMVVRGAPAIGITAAYAVVLAARARFAACAGTWKDDIEADLDHLARARPTAVNLAWALTRMRGHITRASGDPTEPLLSAARAIHQEDVAANRIIGAHGASLIEPTSGVLTHCNTGSLATGGYGTALGVIRSAFAAGRIATVYAGETRPWLQGARLTAWELLQDGIPVTLIADGAAAMLMRDGGIGWVIVGADRIAANGDVANKIGTYSLAVAARHHGIGFMVVAPTSTLDPDTPNGQAIPIETRAPEELLFLGGQRVAAEGAGAWNPVFDITPAELVSAIVTEQGVVERPDTGGLARLIRG